ncbi:MAG: response regulator [Calditrichaeota bacterium]|nr:response regulator [Calditrichota bacterium]
MRILIVDDSAFARSFVIRALKICGMESAEFAEAASGAAAIKLVETDDIDIVFTDLNMPDMSGEDLLKSIRSNPSYSKLPVVVVTSLDNQAKRDFLLKNKATAVLGKPIVLSQLDQIIKNEINISG